jgi:DNA-directed RNA polymerase specialized sigma24 family protein
LFTYEEMSLEEIAEIVGADIGTVKSRLRRARQALQATLSPLLAQDSRGRSL